MSIGTFQQDLAAGQTWEAYVVDWLNTHGIEAWEPKQLPASYQEAAHIAWMKANKRSQAAIERATEYAYKNALKSGWYSKYQVDALARINSSLYRMEVKAFDGWLFDRKDLLIQSCHRLAGKRFPIDVYWVVNKDNGELFWLHKLTLFGSVSHRGSEPSYSVPRWVLRPAFDWLQWGWQTKQSPRYRLDHQQPPKAL